MRNLILSIVGLFLISGPLFGEALPRVHFVPVQEVSGNEMPGFEVEVREGYADEAGNALPGVFRGAAKEWGTAELTPEYFVDAFGEYPITVYSQKVLEEVEVDEEEDLIPRAIVTTMGDHVKDIIYNAGHAGYLIGDIEHNKTDDFVASDTSEESILEALNLEVQSNFPQIRKAGVYILFVGSENSVASLHSHDVVFLNQIYGIKKVILIDPRHGEVLKCVKDEGGYFERCFVDIMDCERVEKEDGDVYAYETLVVPGDVLYIPDGWLHDVRAQKGSPSISISSGF